MFGAFLRHKWFLIAFGLLLVAISIAISLRSVPKAPAMKVGVITGSFVQPWYVERWRPKDWEEKISDLQDLGVTDHLIWQWTVDSGSKKSWYPTRIPGFKKAHGMGLKDPLGACLSQVKKSGMKIWLGLNWNYDWWDNYANNKEWLKNEFDISIKVADELWGLYGNSYKNTIAGFYLTTEMDNDNFADLKSQDNMKLEFKRVIDHIHRIIGKPVMIAPFCSDSGCMSQYEWQIMWENILSTADIDVINLQDGCGSSDDGRTTHTTIKTVGSWFAVTKRAIRKVRPSTQLWADLETFDMDADDNYYPVKDFSRVLAQAKAVEPYVSRISSFAVIHFQIRSKKSRWGFG